jgi:hypothetical protein
VSVLLWFGTVPWARTQPKLNQGSAAQGSTFLEKKLLTPFSRIR